MVDIIVCPQCKTKLSNKRSGFLVCNNCRNTFQIEKDIYNFLTNGGYYWGEVSQDIASKLVRTAKTKGFQRSASEIGMKIPGMYEYMMSYLRADWLFDCMNLKSTNRCLDIGSGWGAIAFGLSYQFDEVWSLEAVAERIEFQKVRASQEKRKNIKFVRSDWLSLPFKDESFDLVSCNGVLEWVGLSDFSLDPRDLQIAFLKEIHRVLKPGGCVYIGIENRFAPFLFLGDKDHSGLPFTSLVPRSFADFLVKKYRKTGGKFDQEKRTDKDWPDYRTYTYSKWGYEKLLSDAKFKDVKVSWSIAYNSPSDSGLIDKESFSFLLKLFKNHDFNTTLLSSIATKLGSQIPGMVSEKLIAFLSPSFLIDGYKGKIDKQTFVSEVLKAKTGVTSFLRRSGTHGLSSKVNYFLLRNGKPISIAKFSRFKKYERYLEKEISHLTKWNDMKVTSKQIQGRKVYFEEFLDGAVCQTLDLEDNLKAIDWLIKFQKKTARGYWNKKDFENHAVALLNKIKNSGLLLNSFKSIEDKIKRYISSIDKIKLSITSVHGDFVKTNILFDRESKIYVIDWEFFEESGNPMFDFIFFLLNNSLVGGKPEIFENNWTGEGEYSEIIKELVYFYGQKYNLTSRFIVESVPLVLLAALLRRVDDPFRRHLDIETFVKLLFQWMEMENKAIKWLSKYEKEVTGNSK